MSIKETGRVWDHSAQDGTALLLLLAIADSANEWGHAWPGRKHLAKYARCDEATVSRLLKKIEDGGELYTARRRGRPNHYVVLVGLSDTEKTGRREMLDRAVGSSDKSSLPAAGGSDLHVTPSSDTQITRGRSRSGTTPIHDPLLDPLLDPSKKKDSPGPRPAGAPAAPRTRAPRTRTGLEKAVIEGSFGLTGDAPLGDEGYLVGRIVHWLKSHAPAAGEDEVRAFYRWYQDRTGGAAAPRDRAKFALHYRAYLESPAGGPVLPHPDKGDEEDAALAQARREEIQRYLGGKDATR